MSKQKSSRQDVKENVKPVVAWRTGVKPNEVDKKERSSVTSHNVIPFKQYLHEARRQKVSQSFIGTVECEKSGAKINIVSSGFGNMTGNGSKLYCAA